MDKQRKVDFHDDLIIMRPFFNGRYSTTQGLRQVNMDSKAIVKSGTMRDGFSELWQKVDTVFHNSDQNLRTPARCTFEPLTTTKPPFVVQQFDNYILLGLERESGSYCKVQNSKRLLAFLRSPKLTDSRMKKTA